MSLNQVLYSTVAAIGIGALAASVAAPVSAQPKPPQGIAASTVAIDADGKLSFAGSAGVTDLRITATNVNPVQSQLGFDGDATVPAAIPAALRRKILVENPLATYDRLQSR